MITSMQIFELIRRGGLLALNDSSEKIIVNPNESLFTNIEDIHPEDIPVVIGKSFEMIGGLEKQNSKAIEAAKKAEKGADSAKEKSAGFGKKKAAIEALQDAGVETAEALVDMVEAQKLSLGLHRQMAEITKYLFALGVGSLALNRSVVRELEAKLTGASAEELSELAKAEVLSVIRQLKAQEDMMLKQEKMNSILKEHNKGIAKLVETDNIIEKKLKLQLEINKRFDKNINTLIEVDNCLDNELKEQINTIKRIKKELKVSEEKNDQFDKSIEKQAEIVVQLNKQLSEHNKNISCLENELQEQREVIEQLQNDLKTQANTYEIQNEILHDLTKQIEEQNQFFNTFKVIFSKKVIIAYIVGGLGALTGIASALLILLT